MFDRKALYPVSAGVYLFTCLDSDGKRAIGRTVDAVSQVNSAPAVLTVSLHKGGYVDKVVRTTGHFSLTILAEDAPLELIKGFGMRSSKDVDKFEWLEVQYDEKGAPWVADGALSQVSCDITAVLDQGDHLLLIADATDAQVLAQGNAMTYAQYRALK